MEVSWSFTVFLMAMGDCKLVALRVYWCSRATDLFSCCFLTSVLNIDSRIVMSFSWGDLRPES